MTKDWDSPQKVHLMSKTSNIPEHVPPALAELFKLMPAPHTPWPLYDRIAFLKALAATCDVVYGKANPIIVA